LGEEAGGEPANREGIEVYSEVDVEHLAVAALRMGCGTT
jgi:hypothetical protein